MTDKKLRKDPTKKQLRKLFDYDELTGQLINKERPGQNRFNARFAGKTAGTFDTKSGRIRVGLFGRLFYASRLIYIFHKGAIPKGKFIDHEKRNTLDNRIEGLRLCTSSQNSCNRAHSSTTGMKGVTRIKNKWMARITKNGKVYYLGVYDSPIDAGIAYDTAARKLHGKFAKLNFG